jgi:hydroxypyruvate reductase
MKETLRQLFLATLDDLSLDRVMPRKVACQGGVLRFGQEEVELDRYKKVIAIAIGKAAFPMVRSLSEIVQPRVVSGLAVSSEAPPSLPYFVSYQGGHPYPDIESVRAAEVALEALSDLRPHHLVVYLLSGGGSAICEKPISDEISLEDLREFYRVLVTCGADIVQMNVLRKHFSAIKGGRLARRAFPAKQVTLYVSDVPPDKPSTVASGPTMPDESTADDTYEIVEGLGILDQLPASVRSFFHDRRIPETPKPDHEAFLNNSWFCLLDNRDGLAGLEQRAKNQGWIVETDVSVDDWPVEKAVDHLLAKLRAMRREHAGRTVALLTGGELSCPVVGDGNGGRNQAFVLDCVPKIAGENIAVVSAGTDGIDGNSPAAGAVADGLTLKRAGELHLSPDDFARRSDSYHFFERLQDDVTTGRTGTNVRDLRLFVAW